MATEPQDDHVRYTLRVPAPLYNRIKRATGSGSMNAKIVDALEQLFPSPKGDAALSAELYEAAQDILSDWSSVVKATGQDPEQNAALTRLKALLEKAEGK